MGVIEAVALALFGLASALLISVTTKLVADDAKEWLPWLRRFLIRRAVSSLPEHERDRYLEEWESYVGEFPGEIAKVIVAFGLVPAAKSIAYSDSLYWARMTKRSFDLLVALFGLMILFPILATAAALIKLDSPGPIFYRQPRIGPNGLEFEVFNFRTTILSDEHARRITALGQFLRETSIDVLPQLINVLQGHMSIVGPPPLLRREHDPIGERNLNYRGDLYVKPGLISLTQLENYRKPNAQAKREIEGELANIYIRNRSLWSDLKIVFQTVFVITFTKPSKRK